MRPNLTTVLPTGAGVYHYVGSPYEIVELVKMGAIPFNKDEYKYIRRYVQLWIHADHSVPFEFYANKDLRSKINDALN